LKKSGKNVTLSLKNYRKNPEKILVISGTSEKSETNLGKLRINLGKILNFGKTFGKQERKSWKNLKKTFGKAWKNLEKVLDTFSAKILSKLGKNLAKSLGKS
jgi:hypothetical protein